MGTARNSRGAGRRRLLLAGTVGALLGGAARHATGQRVAGITAIRVLVIGDDSLPLVGARIDLRDNRGAIVASALTDSAGTHTFRVQMGDTAALAVTEHLLGFMPGAQDVTIGPDGDVTTVARLTRAPLDMAAVVASAPRNTYLLTAQDITRSTRVIDNAMDAIDKLRPDMRGDRGRDCPVVKNVWINGRRVWTYVPPLAHRTPGSPIIQLERMGRSLPDLLKSVDARDIASIQYVNCWDVSDPRMGSYNALYVQLKPGVSWNWNQGTVRDSNPPPPE